MIELYYRANSPKREVVFAENRPPCYHGSIKREPRVTGEGMDTPLRRARGLASDISKGVYS